jgi:hypothetical protein
MGVTPSVGLQQQQKAELVKNRFTRTILAFGLEENSILHLWTGVETNRGNSMEVNLNNNRIELKCLRVIETSRNPKRDTFQNLNRDLMCFGCNWSYVDRSISRRLRNTLSRDLVTL